MIRAGTLATTGMFNIHALSLHTEGAFEFEVNLTTASFSVLNITSGSLALGAGVDPAAFDDLGTGNPSLTIGQMFPIVEVTGGGTLSGTFEGLPNGSSVSIDGDGFTINYNLVPNEVTLTVNSTGPSPQLFSPPPPCRNPVRLPRPSAAWASSSASAASVAARPDQFTRPDPRSAPTLASSPRSGESMKGYVSSIACSAALHRRLRFKHDVLPIAYLHGILSKSARAGMGAHRCQNPRRKRCHFTLQNGLRSRTFGDFRSFALLFDRAFRGGFAASPVISGGRSSLIAVLKLMNTFRFLLFPLILFVGESSAMAQTDDAFLTKFESTFEVPGGVPAKDFVPAAVMSGRLHTVRPLASNDGLRNTYYMDTPSGVQEITGTPALITRIREIYAIDHLRGVSKTEEFGKALANAGKAKIDSAGQLLSDPFGTIKNVPKGASRFFGRIGEGLKSVGNKDEGGGGAVAGILGVTSAKAKLAAQLGVSPYSTNEELQSELTKVAQASAGGGLVVNVAASAAGGGAGAALTVVGVNQSLSDVLTNSTAEDLRMLNRKKLLALGVDRKLTEEFLMHPWFSPWVETITTDALANIGVNPSAFLSDAVRALTPEDAFFFQRVAQIMANYRVQAAPLRAIHFENGIITALDTNGVLVVPVSLDYAIWDEHTARRAEEFIALDRTHDNITGLMLWTDGRLSERLCEELKKRGIAYRTDVLGH